MDMTRGMLRVIGEYIAPLRARVASMVRRATTTLAVEGAPNFPGLRARASAGPDEDHEDAEVLEPYGFASVPPDGSKAVLLCPDGNTAHPILIQGGSPSLRITGLATGEVAIYVGGPSGARVVCRNSGTIEVQPAPGQKVRLGPEGGSPMNVARLNDATLAKMADIATMNALVTAWNATQPAGGPILALPGVTLTPIAGTGTITSAGTGAEST